MRGNSFIAIAIIALCISSTTQTPKISEDITPWKKQFPGNIKMLTGDSLSFQLNDYLALDGLTSIEIVSDTCDGVSYRSVIDREINVVLKYPDGVTGCNQGQQINLQDSVYLLCNGGEKLLYANIGLTAETQTQQIIDLTKLSALDDYSLKNCGAMRASKSSNTLYMVCDTIKNTPPSPSGSSGSTSSGSTPSGSTSSGSTPSGSTSSGSTSSGSTSSGSTSSTSLQQGVVPRALLVFNVEEKNNVRTAVLSFGQIFKQTAEYNWGSNPVVLVSQGGDKKQDYVYVVPNIGSDVIFGATVNTDEKRFDDESYFSWATILNGVSVDSIVDLGSDSLHLSIVTKKDLIYSLYFCEVGVEGTKPSCINQPVYTYTAEDKNQEFALMNRVRANRIDIDIVVASNSNMLYLVLYRDENSASKYSFDNNGVTEITYAVKTLYKNAPQGFAAYGNRLILTGADANGNGISSYIYLDGEGQKSDLSLESVPGVILTNLNMDSPTTETMLVCQADKIRVLGIQIPSIVVDTQGKGGPQYTCTLKATVGGKSSSINLSFNVQSDPKIGESIEIAPQSSIYSNTKTSIPIFSDGFAGNDPKLSVTTNDGSDIKGVIYYLNDLNIGYGLNKSNLKQDVQPTHLGKLSYIGGNLYYSRDSGNNLIIQCTRSDITQDMACIEIFKFEDKDIAADSKFEVREYSLIGKNVFLICDTSSSADNNSAVIYTYNTQSKKGTALKFNNQIQIQDAMMQVHDTFIYIYTVGTFNNIATVNVARFPENDVYTTEMIIFNPVNEIGVVICPNQIISFPHNTNQFAIYSTCKNDDGSINKSIFQVKYSLEKDKQTKVELLDIVNLSQIGFDTPKICIADGRFHILEMKDTAPFKHYSMSTRVGDNSLAIYPVEKFIANGISKVIDASCGRRTNTIHILVEQKDDKKTRTLVNLNGEAQATPTLRIHSTIDVASNLIGDISAGFNPDTKEGIIVYSMPDAPSAFGGYALQLEGPRMIIDATRTQSTGDRSLVISNGSSSQAFTVTLRDFNINGDISFLNPKQRFNIDTSAKSPATLRVSDFLSMNGHVIDIEYSSRLPSQNVFMSEKPLTTTTDIVADKTLNFIGTRTLDGGLIAAWTTTQFGIYQAGNMLLDSPINGRVMDVDIVTLSNKMEDTFPVVFVIIDGLEGQIISIAFVDENRKWIVVENGKIRENLEGATFFVNPNNNIPDTGIPDLSFYMIASDNFLAPQLSFYDISVTKIDTEPYTITVSTNGAPRFFDEFVYSFSAVNIGEYIITATLAGNSKGIQFDIIKQVEMVGNQVLDVVRSATSFLFEKGNKQKKYHLEHQDSIINCIPTGESQVEAPVISCFASTMSMYSYSATFTLNNLDQIASDDTIEVFVNDNTYMNKALYNIKNFKPINAKITKDYAAVHVERFIDASEQEKDTIYSQDAFVVIYSLGDQNQFSHGIITGLNKIVSDTKNFNFDFFSVNSKKGSSLQQPSFYTKVVLPTSQGSLAVWGVSPSFVMSIKDTSLIDLVEDSLNFVGLSLTQQYALNSFVQKKFSGTRWIRDLPQGTQMLSTDTTIFDMAYYLNMDGLTDIKFDDQCKNLQFTKFVKSNEGTSTQYPTGMTGCNLFEQTFQGDQFYALCSEGTSLRLAQFSKGTPDMSVAIDLVSTKIEDGTIVGCSSLRASKSTGNIYVYCETKKSSESVQVDIIKTYALITFKLEVIEGKSTLSLQGSAVINQKSGRTTGDRPYIHILALDDGTDYIYVLNNNIGIAGFYLTFNNEFELGGYFENTNVANFPSGPIISIISDFKNLFAIEKKDNDYKVYVCGPDAGVVGSNLSCSQNTIFSYQKYQVGKANVMIKRASNLKDIDVVVALNSMATYALLKKDDQDTSYTRYSYDPNDVVNVEYSEDTAFNNYPTHFSKFGDRLLISGKDINGVQAASMIFVTPKSKIDIPLKFVDGESNGAIFLRPDINEVTSSDIYCFMGANVRTFEVVTPNLKVIVDSKATSSDIECKVIPEFLSVSITPIPLTISIITDATTTQTISVSENNDAYSESITTVPVFSDNFEGNNPQFEFGKADADTVKGIVLYNNALNVNYLQKHNLQQQGETFKDLEYIGNHLYLTRSPKSMIVVSCDKTSDSINMDCKMVTKILNTEISAQAFIVKESKMVENNLFIICDTSAEVEQGGSDSSKIYIKNLYDSKATPEVIGLADISVDAATLQVNSGIVFIYLASSIQDYAALQTANFPIANKYSSLIKFEEVDAVNTNICPTEIEFFPHNGDQFVIYSECSNVDGSNTIKSLFQFTYSREQPKLINLVSAINVNAFKIVDFCLTDKQIHLFGPNDKGEFIYESHRAGRDDSSVITYPIFSYVAQAGTELISSSCGFEKNMVHLMFSTTIGTEITNTIVNINGQSQYSPNKRIHSVVKMESSDITEITGGSSHTTGEAIVLFAMKGDASAFGAYALQPEGPRIVIDATPSTYVGDRSYTLKIADKAIGFGVKYQAFKANPDFSLKDKAKLLPIDKPDPFNFGDYVNIDGPVGSITYKGSGDVSISEILSDKKEAKISTETTDNFIGLKTNDGDLYIAWTATSFNIYQNGAQLIKDVIMGSVLDAEIVTFSMEEKSYNVGFVVANTVSGQQIFAFYQDNGAWKITTSYTIDSYIENARFFYDYQTKLTAQEPALNFYMAASDNYLTPQIIFANFFIDRAQSSISLTAASFTRKVFSERIYSFAVNKFDRYLIATALVGNLKGIQFTLAGYNKDGESDKISPLKTTSAYISDRSGDESKPYHLEHEDSTIQCSVVKSEISGPVTQCFISTRDIYSYSATFTFNNLDDAGSDKTKALISDDGASLKNLHFNLNGFTPLRTRISGAYAAVLLKKEKSANTPTSTVMRMLGDKLNLKDSIFSKDYLLAIYRIGITNRFPETIISTIGAEAQTAQFDFTAVAQATNSDMLPTISYPSAKGAASIWSIRNDFVVTVKDASKIDSTKDSFVLEGLTQTVDAPFDKLTPSGKSSSSSSPSNSDPEKTPTWKKLMIYIGAGAAVILLLLIGLTVYFFMSKDEDDDDDDEDLKEADAETNSKQGLTTNTESDYSKL